MDNPLAGYTIPTYVSHKRVKALEIATADRLTCRITFIGSAYPGITLPADMWARYQPAQGDYLILYEDGYLSFSPRQQFLDGYKPEGQSFTDIKQEIVSGKANANPS